MDSIILIHVDQISFEQELDSSRMDGDGRREALPHVLSSPQMRAEFVKFSNGGRTKWHRHTGEQVLFATKGTGFVQSLGGRQILIQEGDRAYIPARAAHRHGASSKGSDTFIHLAITTGETHWNDLDLLT